MTELESSLLDDGMTNGKKKIYVQIPTAAAQESETRLAYWRTLGEKQAARIGVEPLYLPIYTHEDAFKEEFVEAVKGAAIVYMSGGDPHYLANTLVGTPLWESIHENWKTGGSLAGCSAGAMVMSSHIPNFRFTKREPTVGLNLLPNIRVIPHFDKFFRWIPESAAKVLMSAPSDTSLVGIDELTALIRRSGEVSWSVHGHSEVHILNKNPTKRLRSGESINLDIYPTA